MTPRTVSLTAERQVSIVNQPQVELLPMSMPTTAAGAISPLVLSLSQEARSGRYRSADVLRARAPVLTVTVDPIGGGAAKVGRASICGTAGHRRFRVAVPVGVAVCEPVVVALLLAVGRGVRV